MGNWNLTYLISKFLKKVWPNKRTYVYIWKWKFRDGLIFGFRHIHSFWGDEWRFTFLNRCLVISTYIQDECEKCEEAETILKDLE